MVLIYEFWTHDIPTDVVKNFLKELNLPYKEEISRRNRTSLYSQSRDEWSKIYVDAKDVINWLKCKIDSQLREYC